MTPEDMTLMLDQAFDQIEYGLLPRAATVLDALVAAAEVRGNVAGMHEVAAASRDLSRDMQLLNERASGRRLRMNAATRTRPSRQSP